MRMGCAAMGEEEECAAMEEDGEVMCGVCGGAGVWDLRIGAMGDGEEDVDMTRPKAETQKVRDVRGRRIPGQRWSRPERCPRSESRYKELVCIIPLCLHGHPLAELHGQNTELRKQRKIASKQRKLPA